MNTLEHYVNMRLAFIHVHDNQEILTTAAILAEKMSCTIRNANLIMKKMIENEWISWTPQKGRGRQSTLIFHLSLLEASRTHVSRLINEKKLEEAYTFCTWSELPPSVKGVLLNLLQNQFGFHSSSEFSRRVDVLKIPNDEKIHTLDPAKIAIVHEAHIVTQIFDTLIKYDKKSNYFQPGLAFAWEEKSSGREWTFYLRKGVPFHHGKTLTAEDVQYTFNRLRFDENLPTKGLFDIIKEVEMIDEVTVHFILKETSYFFLDLISSFYASIIPKDVKVDELHPVGTGPFQIGKHDENILTLEAFTNHFLGRPFLDRIEMWYVPKSYINKLEDEGMEHEKTTFKELGSYFFVFNFNKEGIHHNHYLRLAIQNLLDQQQLVSELGFPRRMVATSFLVAKSEGSTPVTNSMERAREYLKLSGYNGETIKLGTFDFDEAMEDTNWLKERCRSIGLNLEIISIPLSNIYEKTQMSTCDLFYSGETFEENELLSYYILYKSENSVLRFSLNDSLRDKLDCLLSTVHTKPTIAERMDYIQHIEEWFIKEAMVIFTYHTYEEQNYHKSLKGIEVTGYGMPDFRRLWVKRSQEDSKNELVSYSIFIP
ncbi:ABC transporter substrate-binding protein [Bacillus sp. 31A1R]|uniref:ABC transporter substrate-binding protein n=1 Tax=Robertmurraya mangrovi TaxID=3098077 RepID=A0ABU5J2F2_9BACI|nr:ABC transporter substrate-binding protein [Bacillus sp. 31A1R]MDZ5473594.1 ABC transporter substrate-binding protein [Bacillus sp. 31A1R]